MIKEFVEAWDERKGEIESMFRAGHPEDYEDIVKAVVRAINPDRRYGKPDPELVRSINTGDYQGTLLFVLCGSDFQTDDFWYVKVAYGSCSCCDTLEAIRSYSDDTPTDEQVKDYMALALHILQGIKELKGDTD